MSVKMNCICLQNLTLLEVKNAPSNYAWLYEKKNTALHWHCVPLYYRWQEVDTKSEENKSHGIILNSSPLFYPPKIHVFSVHKSGTFSLCMSLLSINCLINRRHCDPQAGSRACHSCQCEWCMRECGRQAATLKVEVEGRSFILLSLCRNAYQS